MLKKLPTHIKDFDKDPLESELIYWDTNFAAKLLIENQSYHPQCKAFLRRLKKRQPIIIFSELLFLELWHALLIIELQNTENTEDINIRRICKKRPGIVRNLAPRIEKHMGEFKKILGNFTDWLAIPIREHIRKEALRLSEKYNITSYDATHISTMLFNDIYPIKNIVTFDWQLEDIADLNVWTKNGVRRYCERHNITFAPSFSTSP